MKIIRQGNYSKNSKPRGVRIVYIETCGSKSINFKEVAVKKIKFAFQVRGGCDGWRKRRAAVPIERREIFCDFFLSFSSEEKSLFCSTLRVRIQSLSLDMAR